MKTLEYEGKGKSIDRRNNMEMTATKVEEQLLSKIKDRVR